jgi:hypothetical protein
MAATAVMGLAIEAMRKIVSRFIGAGSPKVKVGLQSRCCGAMDTHSAGSHVPEGG